MKKIEAIFRHGVIRDVYTALGKVHCPGMTIFETDGQDKNVNPVYEVTRKGLRTPVATRTKIEIIANDEDVDKLCDAISKAAFTGKEGGGRIFIYPIDETVRTWAGIQRNTIGQNETACG
jgi:nitrogen regulatory protein PII